MKTLWMKTIVLMFLGVGMLHAQDREEVPGDNFSLEGSLELFKKSASPEEFERLLNLPESEVNNLDLNGDGDIDYIRVIDRNEGNIHTFTMQAVISRTEFQDIAVISLEKFADGRAVLQITGDADVYGIETIIEPTAEVRVNAGTTTTRTVVNVWDWPSVQYVYSPFYTPWVSPWYWDYRPFWWRPWRPVAYMVYYPRWTHFRSYYSYCDVPRIRYASRIYYPHRAASVVVYNRHRDQISTYRSTRTVYGDRGRDDSRNSRTMRYDNRNRSLDANRTNRSSSTDWSSRANTRERGDNTQRQRVENRTTETNEWRNRDNTVENRTTRTTNNERGSSSNNRSFERSSNQNNRTVEQPRENRSNNSGSGGNRPEVRQESRQSKPAVSPSQSRQSNGGSQQRSNSGSGSGSSGKRGRD